MTGGVEIEHTETLPLDYLTLHSRQAEVNKFVMNVNDPEVLEYYQPSPAQVESSKAQSLLH
jgi:hypothetical protein